MAKKAKFDFSGFATKFNVACSDGRTILKDAFKHMDGKTIPLVWQHMHDDVKNVLGHAVLENRDDGVYAYGYFNETKAGKDAKALIAHGDVDSLSIYANQLVEKSKKVVHGQIRELSLVLAGANPGAKIENINFAHGDSSYISEEDAIVFLGELKHGEEADAGEDLEHGADSTVAEVIETMNDEQKDVLYALVAEAVGTEGGDMKQADQDDNNLEHSGGGTEMKKNIFDKEDKAANSPAIGREELRGILKHAQEIGSFKKALGEYLSDDTLAHAGTYGIDDIDVLFPDARKVGEIDMDKRRTEWVSVVLNGISKTPFSRIKSLYADITKAEARAKGYVKGNEKMEEVFPLFKRTTDPTTIYKKQKLDRDDIIDITDMDVVAWLKAEMRLMLDEEQARAYLIGDGRDVDDADKIDETKIRPMYTDADIYAPKLQLASDTTLLAELEAIKRGRKLYKGSGAPLFFTTIDKTTDWTLMKDDNGQYRFKTIEEVAKFIGVKKIVEVEVMEGVTRDVEGTVHDLIGIMVNLKDYTSGADKGGRVAMFDDFDIDFNQQKYLIETRCSGALKKIRACLVVEKAQAAG